MTDEIDRRTVLRGIGAGAMTLGVAGTASAGGRARFVATAPGADAAGAVEDSGFAVEHALAGGEVLLVSGPDDEDALAGVEAVGKVTRDFAIELKEPERIESTDESIDEDLFSLQWDKQDSTTDAAIAHDTATGDGATVAIIDTGVDPDHPDLESNVDRDAGRLFRYGEVSHDARDVYGHGTHVAGIAAASDEGTQGIVGTAPDAEIVSLRVFFYDDVDGDGDEELTATFGDILLAIDHAAAIGADAMNMSIGTPPIPPQGNAGGIRGSMERVVQHATTEGSLVVVSAGNSAADLQEGGYFTLPNSLAGAMSISATGPNDELVFYSNYGTNEIDVGAPGGGYETLEKTLCREDGTVAGSCEDEKTRRECEECDPTEWPFPTNLVLSSVPPEIYDTEYAYFAGTSMAAPQVTGTAALVREVAPDASARRVERAIEQGAESVDGAGDDELGAGRLNCDRALDADVIE